MQFNVQKVKFNGLDFILPTPEEGDSPIATITQFQKGECPYAHLYRDEEKIKQFGKQIGTLKDIEFGEMITVEVDLSVAKERLWGDSWLAGIL